MMSDALPLTAVSFSVGIVMGITGMGGGALMTPALVFFGIPPTSAVANDLVAASINKTVGALTHWRSGSPNMQLAGLLMLGSVPTAFIGAFLIDAVGSTDTQDAFLEIAIGITLLVAALTYAFRMYLGLPRDKKNSAENTAAIIASTSADHADGQPAVRPVSTVVVGAIGGLFVGLTSVGSGSLIMVTLLIMYPTFAAVKLVGTDLVQAVPLVLAAAIGHVVVTGVDWNVLIPLIIGGMPGTFLGSRLANSISQSLVRRGITFVLTITAMAMLDVPVYAIAGIAIGLVVIGPFLWGFIRVRHGLPAFDHLSVEQLRSQGRNNRAS